MVMCTYNSSRTRDRAGESGVKKEGRTKTSEKKGQEKTKMRPLADIVSHHLSPGALNPLFFCLKVTFAYESPFASL